MVDFEFQGQSSEEYAQVLYLWRLRQAQTTGNMWVSACSIVLPKGLAQSTLASHYGQSHP